MGDAVDNVVGLDTKTSPRLAAIQRAQTELRQEFDVREERRRELEFLEKGGNPLDFKFDHASFSIQCTSHTDHLVEQYVISEAKGSAALAASPPGDSVESSGRPAGSVGRESNTADNLLLFDGENSNVDGAGNVKRNGKRAIASAMEKPFKIGGCSNMKETDDSVIFRTGVKGQAYARRNRSKSTRDGSCTVLADLPRGHNNIISIQTSPLPDFGEKGGSLQETGIQDSDCSITKSKVVIPNDSVISTTCASSDLSGLMPDSIEKHKACEYAITGNPQKAVTKMVTHEALPDNDCNIDNDCSKELSNRVSDIAPNSTDFPSCDLVGKDETILVASDLINDSAEYIKEFSSGQFNAVDSNKENPNVSDVIDHIITEIVNTDADKVATSCDNGSFVDGNMGGEQVLKTSDVCSNRDPKEHTVSKGSPLKTISDDPKEECKLSVAVTQSTGEAKSGYQVPCLNTHIQIKIEEGLCEIMTGIESEMKQFPNDNKKIDVTTIPKAEKQFDNLLDDVSSAKKHSSATSSFVSAHHEQANPTFQDKGSSEHPNSASANYRLAKKAREDAILKEARMIEANHRMAAMVSTSNTSLEKRKKCQWDFVLEEMAWLANDFMQERIWKIHAASQVCNFIASSSNLKFRCGSIARKPEDLAQNLAKEVLQFWQSVKLCQASYGTPDGIHDQHDLDLTKPLINDLDVKKDKCIVAAKFTRPGGSIKEYAARFLKYNNICSEISAMAEAPPTPDKLNDAGLSDVLWDDQLSEESLFYSVPPGSMEAYRESVESHWARYQKLNNSMHQEDCEASICDFVAERTREITYEEDEGEAGTYALPGSCETGMPAKFNNEKRQAFFRKSYGAGSYDIGTDWSRETFHERKRGNQALIYAGKRPSDTSNVSSIPTKRIRTGVRQRHPNTGLTGALQGTSKTDASSGDTSSLQDDQSSLHGRLESRKYLDVESTFGFERISQFKGEVSMKPKKKKKPKHFGFSSSLNLTDSGVFIVPGKGSSIEQRLLTDHVVLDEQKDHLKRRLENKHFESNGNTGIYGLHVANKPKLFKQLPDTSPEAVTPVAASIASPVASQMSNMSNSNRLIRIMANRDRGKKNKALKLAAGPSGPGSSWSVFEEQALVVLVHDMGPNWELVSDVINSILQCKPIFRKPKECKERHKILMDKSAGDGADSAEDSGSSQPYPLTLPGIPKGSARQLLQRLQGPMQDDTLKMHFEKIIMLGRQLHSCGNQKNGPAELKQIAPSHSSHAIALSQTCHTGMGVLTPKDLCDAAASSPDSHALGHQGSHTSGLAHTPHQGSMAPIIPTSAAGSHFQVGSGVIVGSSLPSSSVTLSASSRDVQRYGMPRQTSLSVDDMQRMPHYGNILPGRNIQQSSMPVSGSLPMGVDRGVRMLPNGSGMGMMCSINRGMPLSRPGFQGMGSSGMLNMVSPGGMLSTNGIGTPNSVNVHSGTLSGSGNAMMRPHDALQMLRPGQNNEDHRQMMMQELHLQAAQSNGPFSSSVTTFSSSSGCSPIQTFPAQQLQHSHQMPHQNIHGSHHHPHTQGANHLGPQQQSYAIRFAKERQLQQRIISQPQHPFSGPNGASSVQNGPQIQQHPHISSVNPVPQTQPKQQNIARPPQTGCGMSNQIVKHKQCLQAQQQTKNNQQQRQQSQQPAKLLKGLGRGAIVMHQNFSNDAPHISSIPVAAKNQVSEKHLIQQGQGFFPGSPGLSSSLSQPTNQQNIFPRPFLQSAKQVSSLPTKSDTGALNHGVLIPQQSSATSLPLSVRQQQQHRPTNHAHQSLQRMSLQQNCPMHSDSSRILSSTDQSQANQIPSTPNLQCADSVTPASVISTSQWKPEPSYDTGTPTPTHSGSSQQDNVVGSEALTSSNQQFVHRQFSGNASMFGHATNGQWQNQQQPNQQQKQLQQSQHQNQQRQTAQGNLYIRPPNSGPG